MINGPRGVNYILFMKAALRVGLISTVVPKKCGIATFSRDLFEGMLASNPDIELCTIAAEEPGEQYDYQLTICDHVVTNDPGSYVTAAETLNNANLDVVLLQHEFGLYGGSRAKFKQKGAEHDDPTGDYILNLLEKLTVPIVTTLHTVIPRPDPARRRVIRRISELSQYVVAMSRGTKWLLTERYDIPARKVIVIPHGVPTIPQKSRLAARQALGLPLRNTYLTVTGLLGPNKGVDLIIKALPSILKQHPSVRLIVAGQTHPNILARDGEAYREELGSLAESLGVRENVLFINAYMPTAELMQYLRASDVYLTIHRDPEQIASGTLAYAVGAGLPTISTPYLYAKELLAHGRGMLVPFENSTAITRAVNRLLSHPDIRHALTRNLRAYRHSMAWPVVAKAYLKLIEKRVLSGREHAVL